MFIDAVNKENVSWPIKYDDLFPYTSNPGASWVGYFTSRPIDKAMIRRGAQLMQSGAHLFALHAIKQDSDRVDDVSSATT
jgi:hypothetical protein